VAVRRIVLVALLGLVASVAIGLGPAMLGDGAREALSAAPADSHHVSDRTAPCVLRADCAGGLGLVTVALLPLVVAAAATVLPAPAPAGRVVTRRERLRSRLAADRLLRPPQA
jgi:hypothetical protein